MHETRPEVFLIARPSIDVDGMRGYLESVGGVSWLDGRLEADERNDGEEEEMEELGRAVPLEHVAPKQ